MSYIDRFIDTDNLITHLCTFIGTITDGAILASYAGFLSVSSVTVYELAIKDIFRDFASKKNTSFGVFVDSHFDRINGRIKLSNLRDEHIPSFGAKYLDRFNRNLDTKDAISIAAGTGSIKSSYSNLIVCRHSFVHQGAPTLTINEIILSYQRGKEVIHSLNVAMIR
ncbi:MAG: HEPN domain-containing protein [Bacteroidia bacterium]|nr:HEPN domain-containing protein [Bacteroidia bacterium]